MKKIDMTGWYMPDHGVPNSRLTVIKEDLEYYLTHTSTRKSPRWICLCNCGNITSVRGEDLRSGKVISCGCAKTQTEKRIVDYIGKRFGLLTVLEFAYLNKHKESVWKCKCDCGSICFINAGELRSGDTKSCGCLKASFGALRVRIELRTNNIPFIVEATYEDCVGDTGTPLRYDFLVNNEFLLEIDGPQHFNLTGGWNNNIDKFKLRQKYDVQKDEYAKSHNIPIKRIPYTDWNKITLENIMDDTYLINKE